MAGTKKILIIAAEASACLYAQRLMECWKNEGRDVTAFGVGNKEMESQGFECLGYAEDMAVVGLQEVFPKLRMIRKVFHKIVDRCKQDKPDLVLLLDYPGFNLRLAKKLKELDCKIMYYISPQLWAWKTGRVKIVQAFVDKMLVILPFEYDFYRNYDVNVEFVGHPLLDELKDSLWDEEVTHMERSKYGFLKEDHVLALMPGSRNGEIRHHLERQVQAAEILSSHVPNLKVALFVAPTFSIEQIQALLPQTGLHITVVKKDPFEMVQLADTVLCASGTATLTVALMGKPMVIMYRANALSAFIGKRVLKTRYFGLVNLIFGEEVSPEFLQEETAPENLAEALRQIIINKETREEMTKKLAQTRYKLGDKGATARVAQAIEEMF